ncbi:ROK family transcriptional regulator [Tumebacillus permanentifrigoris]|uniref:MarR family transcriptional regulator n=1 Tax=Tumebacillus permanentifrigoris TaxID=378543 RepID=A0A316D587_9BACL|nr:ROK family transcriptional regulator [Tumebacillus permanentifrigoris]PWK06591.1 MarR family transcriptional regulator [Tumebacillus permanentifrigoris]
MSQSIQVGSFQWMKNLNKSTILNLIRLHGPISRAEIAKLTKLTPPTVTNIVGELMENRLVLESALGESTGGRKPIMLQLNASAFYLIGVYAGAKKVRAVVATLGGTVVNERVLPVPPTPTKEQFLQLLTQVVREVIDDTPCSDQQEFLGIGVGMHGLVDTVRGLSIFAPNLNLHDMPIKDELEAVFNLPVEVENDVRATALAESWFGQGQGIANFICVNVGTGVGAGIIIDHNLYHGASFTAGEMGHTTIDVNGPRCSCGNYGCLEALTSGPAIAQRARQAIRLGKQSRLLHVAGEQETEITGELVYLAALEGDALAVEVLADTGRYLGIGIANMINTLNPSRIILSGGVSRAGDFLLNALRETVQKRALHTPVSIVSIVTSELGANAAAIGGFTLLLRNLLTPKGVTTFE